MLQQRSVVSARDNSGVVSALCFLLLIPGMSQLDTKQAFDLDALRWQSRAVLIFAGASDERRLERQAKAFESCRAEAGERDLKLFEVVGASPGNTALRNRFGVPENSFAVVLVGKDGTRKLRTLEPVDPQDIFRMIDSMPMRKEEMKHRRK